MKPVLEMRDKKHLKKKKEKKENLVVITLSDTSQKSVNLLLHSFLPSFHPSLFLSKKTKKSFEKEIEYCNQYLFNKKK